MPTTEPTTAEAKVSKTSSGAKAKGKENVRRPGKIALNSLKGAPTTSTSLGTMDIAEEDEMDWPWTILADASVGSQPAVFTADGNYFFSVVGTAVRIYSVATGKVVSTLSSSSTGSSESRVATGGGHSDVITAAILNPENPFQLLTASLDGDIKVWDFLDAVLLQTIHVGNPISHMCAHDKFKGQVFIAVPTRLKKNKIGTSSLEKGNTMIYRVSLTPKQSTSSQYSKSSEIVRIGKSKAAISMAISPSGSWLVVIAGHKAYVSQTSSPESGFTKFVSPKELTCLAFHPVDDYFATGDESGQIRLWYCLNNQLTFNAAADEKRAQTTTMHWHAHAVSSLAFTENGAYLLSGGEESVLVIWQLHTGKKEFVPRLGSPILTITVRAAGGSEEEYLLGLADGSYSFVNSGSLSVNRAVSRVRLDPKGIGRPPHTPVPLATHSRTSTLILPASHPSSLQIYSPSTSTLLSEIEVSSSNRVSRRGEKEIEAARVDFVSVSSSGDWMATIDTRDNDEDFSAEVDLKIWQWDSSTWVLNTRIDRPHGSKKIVAMDFLPQAEGKDNELLVTVGLDGNMKTWCIRSVTAKGGTAEDFWISRSIFTFRSETPTDACWSPDGSLLAVCFGCQIALYNPHSSLLLDCLTTMDVRKIDSIRFVGQSGRYILASGRNNAVLWDLINRTVRWHYYTATAIAQVLAHPKEDIAALIIQPYVKDSAIRSSKILHFKPTSSKPFDIRTLPFRFRVVDWNGLDNTSHSLIGITYSWDIVLCGGDARASSSIDEAPREIDSAAGVLTKRTLFQDIFGKSAFADIPADPIASSSIPVSSDYSTKHGQDILSVFDVPAYLAPPVETVYSSLIESFLTRLPEREEPHVPEGHDDTDDMVVDSEPAQSLQQERTVGDAEIDSLIKLFRRQSVDRAPQGNIPNGIVNGVHKAHTNGIRPTTSQSRTPTPKTPRMNGTSTDALQGTSAPDASQKPSAPVTVGKKRKKSIP